ncbi:MAG: hypothetical protein Q9215_001656, partial [Flavoplaca cf. flavocitrina]
MKTCVRNPAHNEMWLAALEGKYGDGKPFGREEWDALLGNFQAVTDYPAAMFAEELVEMYPDAKVVLSNRDVDKWFQSVSQTIDWRYNDPILYILSLIDSHNASWSNMFYRMWAIFSRGDFAKHGKAAFEDHYAHVREVVPKERLLEYRVQEGWEPLCRFLGTEVPEEEFP